MRVAARGRAVSAKETCELDDEVPETTGEGRSIDCRRIDMVEVSGDDDMVTVVVTVMSVMLGDGVRILLGLFDMEGKEVVYLR
jgi:hypothetical protein